MFRKMGFFCVVLISLSIQAINSCYAFEISKTIKEGKKTILQFQPVTYRHNAKKYAQQPIDNTAYPAHIVEFAGTLLPAYYCDQMADTIAEELFPGLEGQYNFMFDGRITCEDNHYEFKVIFEPMDDTATQVAKEMIAKLDEKDFYGAKIHVHPVKAIVYNLILFITNEKLGQQDLVLLNYYPTSLSFHTLKEAWNGTLKEIDDNFKPTKPTIFMPIMQKLFGYSIDQINKDLHKGNTVLFYTAPKFLYGDNLSLSNDFLARELIVRCDMQDINATCLVY